MSVPAPSQLLPPDFSRGQRIVVLYWVLSSISAFVLVIRFWACQIKNQKGIDDWLMFLSWLGLLAIAIMATLLHNLDGFDHLAAIAPTTIPQVLKLIWAAQPFGIMGLVPGKISIAFTILRIRGNTASLTFRWTLYTLSILTFLIAIPTILLQFLQCDPPRALWTPSLATTAKCLKPSIQANYATFSGVWNALLDFVLAIMPATFILELQLSVRRKVFLIVLLGLSLFTGIAASIKIATLKNLGNRSDVTWNLYGLFVWQGVEMFLIILMGSIPWLKPVWDKYFGKPQKDQTAITSSFNSRTRTAKRQYHRQDSNHSVSEPNLLPDHPGTFELSEAGQK